MTSLNQFFNSVQVLAALLVIAIALFYLAFERKPRKR
jgi:hypothetical protein